MICKGVRKLKIKKCNKDCENCKNLSANVDDKGYPWGYECMKYNNSVFMENFHDTKKFQV